MSAVGLFVDANLLVLLVAGLTERSLIGKHRRLREFSEEDYDRLSVIIEEYGGRVFVTPNTLTEASNLLGQHGEPERSVLFNVLRHLIENSEEVIVESRVAADAEEFIPLGLTDAALLKTVSSARPLLTVDLELYHRAARREEGAAFNFRHDPLY